MRLRAYSSIHCPIITRIIRIALGSSGPMHRWCSMVCIRSLNILEFILISKFESIAVTFTKFNLERSHECRFDWLQIHDGRSSASYVIGRFCGTDLPKGGNIISTQNMLYFWFRSDNSTSNVGFELNWTSIPPGKLRHAHCPWYAQFLNHFFIFSLRWWNRSDLTRHHIIAGFPRQLSTESWLYLACAGTERQTHSNAILHNATGRSCDVSIRLFGGKSYNFHGWPWFWKKYPIDSFVDFQWRIDRCRIIGKVLQYIAPGPADHTIEWGHFAFPFGRRSQRCRIPNPLHGNRRGARMWRHVHQRFGPIWNADAKWRLHAQFAVPLSDPVAQK